MGEEHSSKPTVVAYQFVSMEPTLRSVLEVMGVYLRMAGVGDRGGSGEAGERKAVETWEEHVL